MKINKKYLIEILKARQIVHAFMICKKSGEPIGESKRKHLCESCYVEIALKCQEEKLTRILSLM